MGTATQKLTVAPLNLQEAIFEIVGTAPYVQNAFSARVREELKASYTAKAGTKAGKGKKREPRDLQRLFEEGQHRSDDGWNGIPATAFRNAMIDACRMAGFKMTLAKMSVFVEADGFDAIDSTPLVRITNGEPEYLESTTRTTTGVVMVTARPKWAPGWRAKLHVKWDADQFSLEDVSNLLHRSGQQVGIGEGRPFSKNSAGMGWGLFTFAQDTND